MMNDEQVEKCIADRFAALPRKQVFSGRKEIVWPRIASYIQTARLARAQQKTSSGFAFNFFLLRKTYGRVMVVVMVVLLTLTVAGGAAKAMPGETLYTVKKAAEQVEKVLATSDESKAKIHIKHAKRRLAEVKILVENKSEPEIVAKTLEAMKNSTQEVLQVSGATPELKDNAVQLAAEEKQVLHDVKDQSEGETKEAVQSAIADTSDSISKFVGEDTAAAKEGVKGTTVIEEETATSTAQVKTITVKKPVKTKATEITDAPMEGGIDIGGVVIVEDREPVPVEEQ